MAKALASGATASPRESLAAILAVERIREGEFTARLEDFFGSSLGGDALARAALAAAESCEGKELHALHASFLRPIPPSAPLTLLVERLADDGPVACRQVCIRDRDLLCQVTARFGLPGDGPSYQDVRLDSLWTQPEELPSTIEQARAEGWADYARGPIEFRRFGSWPRRPEESYSHVEWMRPRMPLPNDPRIHMAALVFLSDFYSQWACERRIGPTFAHDRFRPLDQTLWIHRSIRWDDWLLLKAVSEIGHAGRALARREIYTRDGQLVASAAQEAYVASHARSA